MTEDTQARHEIREIYNHLVTLSEVVKNHVQQELVAVEENGKEEVEIVPIEDYDEEKLAKIKENVEEESEGSTKSFFEMNGYKPEEKVPCPICGEEYQVEGLSSHINQSDEHPSLSEIFQNEDGKLECPECGTELGGSRTFYMHARRQHDKNLTILALEHSDKFSEEGKIECPLCGQKFNSKEGLLSHIGQSEDKNVSDFYLVKSNYRNPVQDKIYPSYDGFVQSWSDLDTTMTDHFLENFGKLPSQET